MVAATDSNTTISTENPPKNWKDPSFYRFDDDNNEKVCTRPKDIIDHRESGGPLLSYIWCNDELHGQDLYLGAEIGCDNNMYCIPGHANRVLQINTKTNVAKLIGPILKGKYKWLRGVLVNESIYGIPCHTDTVLKIHVPTGEITCLFIDYEDFFNNDPILVQEHREQEWKYHGGSICPIDNCIYTIPQSAKYVLKINPSTDKCTLYGPELPGRYKWYGGVVGKQDSAIYGMPHNSSSVIRIHPDTGVTLHGNFQSGVHNWHGAAAAANGTIVCVAANADTVLCIQPNHPEPILTCVGDETIVKSGRHRKDRKYKYLGATTGPDGRVYLFPCAAERVLAVDTVTMTAKEIGPNIYDTNMERLCQNKWQNGVYIKEHKTIFGIPLSAETILRIDFSQTTGTNDDEPIVTTWKIPSPHKCMQKWEGAVVGPNGIAYTIPNNHKAVMRIELPTKVEEQTTTTTTQEEEEGTSLKKTTRIIPDRPDYRDRDDLVYKSGIPTLRASAHRVKFSLKHRKHNPKPRNANGVETGTLWLPKAICQEQILAYDDTKYNLGEAVVNLLRKLDPNIVGDFRDGMDDLENFVLPTNSTWRAVNGGQVENAQKYLSDAVATDEKFITLFDRLVVEVVLPYLKNRLIQENTAEENTPLTFYYQRPPTLRLQPGPAWAQVKSHNDAEYGHQYGEINFWVPLTDREKTGVDLWCESVLNADDYHPIPAKKGEIIAFHGSACRHYVNTNSTPFTRVSFDFRVGVQGFFDPTWEMQGTNGDHTRREVSL